ncbi:MULTISPECIES: NADP-dependent oxidoreductase [unclassified Rhizobium]|jgi:NADPH:quinone reductase-like Zn-dependent oxidoreductase|uniref:NADP-dependent oxidoreductase n=1 Tax=unclassified Rhizobium TaxID=2613769 RepID=UPI001A9948D5|nr:MULTISPECIES: NADP-dependent oxidoreductase [unclassified Rhizobium]MBX5164286.1 NADP-dependent oxidoreductase [Rhizobium sp. NZLR4b]MBX5169837.1 NADP-dependent oxidoreductase [Rhizobium sp. NZLR1b]MBX5184317.1 NADP-dependent oxidoreductase [Rhizobium sp. NZLR5]MBX5192816.1 NADP-dependent oxidoreductase [Rhizobium sp. NZLR3b]MBX5195964.1 NADP-dependent oxidoreductase [Rhizobium sp. NZLR10]
MNNSPDFEPTDPNTTPLATGRALRLQAYGGPESLTVDRVSSPEPGPGEVLVSVKAAAVNGIDWKIREGYLRERFKLTLPATLGIEMAGVVLRTGHGVTGVKAGDRVMAALGGVGAYADHLVIEAGKLVQTPEGLSDVQAAAIPVASMTAWHVIQAADLDLSGQRVLIQGAAGGVGGFAVQFAKSAGAFVYATASTTSLLHVEALGADEVIDYRHQTLEHLTGKIDFVVDLVGGKVLDPSWALLSSNGLLVSIAAPDVASRAPDGRRGVFLSNKPDTSRLAAIAQQVDAGTLQSTIAEVVGFDDLASAIERNRTGHAPGKIVADLTR